MSAERRPDRHALLELDALLAEVELLRGEGDAARFADDARYRWILLWANLYDLRNHLAHSRLPDVDEALVQRFAWARTDALHASVRQLLRV